MNQIYPKRLINAISATILLLGLIVMLKGIVQINMNFENLTNTDRFSSIWNIAFAGVAVISCIATYKNKFWGWIGITSYLIFSLSQYAHDYFKYGYDHHFILILIIGIVLIVMLMFLVGKSTTRYFNIKKLHLLVVIVIAGISYCCVTIDPISKNQRINSFYINIIDDKIFMGDTLYTGNIYSNHSNYNIHYEGKVIKGLEEGEWKQFFSNGNLKNIIRYRSGIPEGQEISYFSNGSIKEIKNYKEGKLHGKYELWNDVNKVSISGNYINGSRHGNWKTIEGGYEKNETINLDTILNTQYVEQGSSR